jgi:hypothetical protein
LVVPSLHEARRALRVCGWLLVFVPSSLTAQDAVPRLLLVTEAGVAARIAGDGYSDERVFLAVEFGAVWQYDPTAGIGLVLRNGISFQGDTSQCTGFCVVDESVLPWILEVRFRRSLSGPLTLNLGGGNILATSAGLASHLGLEVGDIVTFSLHGDYYSQGWNWLVDGRMRGKAGLVALGVGLAFRLFSTFAYS